MKDLTHAAARGVAWNLVQNLIGRVLSLAVVAILARLVDKAAFGAIALAGVVTTFAELLVNQGYGVYIAQNPDLTDEHKDTAFWVSTGIGVLLTVTIVVAARPLAGLLAGDVSVAPLLRWLALGLALESISVVPTGILVREMRFRQLSLRSLVAAAIAGVVGITCAIAGLGIYSLVVQALVGDLVATVVLWHATAWRPRWRVSIECFKELSRFSAPVFGGAVLYFANRRIDVVIVGRALGGVMLAGYSLGQRVFQIANQILNKSGDAVALSALSKIRNEEERRRALYLATEVTAAICFPIYGGLAVASLPVILTLFGHRWAESAPALTAFAAAGVPISLSYLHAAALRAVGATRGYFVIQIVLAALYLPFLAIVVNEGIAAAAYAYLISLCLIIPVEVWLLRVILKISTGHYVRALIGPAISTVLMCAAALGAGKVTGTAAPALQLATEVLVGLTAYLAALRGLAPRTFQRLGGALKAVRVRA
jgi:PST family polysaccharide transporter